MAETIWLSLVAPLTLPHSLMIAGALLVVAGFIGVRVCAKKTVKVDTSPDAETDSRAGRWRLCQSFSIPKETRKPNVGRALSEQRAA